MHIVQALGAANASSNGIVTNTNTSELAAALKAYTSNPIFTAIRWLATGVQFYHGYKRNGGSIGWGLGWALIPFPIGTPLALAQGYGKRKKK